MVSLHNGRVAVMHAMSYHITTTARLNVSPTSVWLSVTWIFSVVHVFRLGRGAGRHNERGRLRQAKPGDGHHGQLRQQRGGHGVFAVVPGHQLLDRDKHVHRGDPGELFAGDGGRAGGPDGRRLRYVLRDMAAL